MGVYVGGDVEEGIAPDRYIRIEGRHYQLMFLMVDGFNTFVSHVHAARKI